jgi:farnesol dehydrogenase
MGPSVTDVVTETKPRDLNYFNAYEASKAAADLVVLRHVIEEGMHAVLVSPTRVFGPYIWGEPASVSLMIKRYINGNWRLIPGGRHWKGNYVDVQDVVQGHILAMKKGRSGSNYVLAGHNMTYGEFFETLSIVSGQRYRMVVAPIWLQMAFARLHAAFAKLRGRRPDLTTEWVRRGNYHWEVSPARSIEELGVELTSFADSLSRTVESFGHSQMN